jgi:hypothetical protein
MAKKHHCLRKFLLFFDYFGVNVTFRKNDKDQSFSSPIGGAIFLLFAFLSIYYCVINFIPFSLRQNMNLVQSQKSIVPNSLIDFNERKMNIAFTLIFDDNGTVVSDSLLSNFVMQAKLVKMINGTKYPTILETHKCQPSDFYNKTTFESLGLSKFNCINNSNVTVYGSFATQPFQYIEIALSLNKNIATSNPQYYMDLFRKNLILFDLMYLDTSMNFDDVGEPIESYIDSFITYVDYWNLRKINFYFSSFQFSSDDNILFSDPVSSDSFRLDEVYEYSDYMNDRLQNNQNMNLMKLYIRSSTNITICIRQFQKITDYFANMSGLLSQALLVIFIATNFINSFIAEQTIMNKILSYEDFIINKNFERYEDIVSEIKNRDKQDNSLLLETITARTKKAEIGGGDNVEASRRDSYRLLILNRKKNIAERLVQMNNIVATEQPNEVNKNDDSHVIENTHKILDKSKKPIDFNIVEIVLRFFRCNRKMKIKSDVYQKSLKKLHYYFSIFTYIKTVQSVDLVKHLLLDNNQFNLFNFISQPSIAFSDTENDMKMHILTDMKNKNKMKYDDVKELIRSYKIIKKDGDEGLNRKLCEYFNAEIEKFMG